MRIQSGTSQKLDAVVTVDDDGSSVVIEINSSISNLYLDQQTKAIRDVLKELNVSHAHVIVDDNHALDCVLRARLTHAVQALRTRGGLI